MSLIRMELNVDFLTGMLYKQVILKIADALPQIISYPSDESYLREACLWFICLVAQVTR